jgi:hypothetical protein
MDAGDVFAKIFLSLFGVAALTMLFMILVTGGPSEQDRARCVERCEAAKMEPDGVTGGWPFVKQCHCVSKAGK